MSKQGIMKMETLTNICKNYFLKFDISANKDLVKKNKVENRDLTFFYEKVREIELPVDMDFKLSKVYSSNLEEAKNRVEKFTTVGNMFENFSERIEEMKTFFNYEDSNTFNFLPILITLYIGNLLFTSTAAKEKNGILSKKYSSEKKEQSGSKKIFLLLQIREEKILMKKKHFLTTTKKIMTKKTEIN